MRTLTAWIAGGVVGVVAQVTGLAVDATMHAHDPSLAAREGVFTLTNPGHLLLAVGLAITGVSLIGALTAHLARGGHRRRRLLATGALASAVVVVLAIGAVGVGADAQHSAPHDHGNSPQAESDRIAGELGGRLAEHHEGAGAP